MNAHEMIERFRQFTSADLFSIDSCETGQVSEVLCKTESVRIVMTRYEDKVEWIDVDVEVSLPPLPESSDIVVLRGSIDTMIETLEYLKHLISIRFNLELLQEEGILVASGSLRKDAKAHEFEALLPPGCT